MWKQYKCKIVGEIIKFNQKSSGKSFSNTTKVVIMSKGGNAKRDKRH